MRLEAEVSVSASSCRRGEARSAVSAKPGGASSTTRSIPSRTANGAAAQLSDRAASEQERPGCARAPFYPYHLPVFGEHGLGDDSQHAAQGRKGRHRLLGRPRHERRGALDAREGRDPLRLHRQPRPARRGGLRRDPAQGARLRRARRRAWSSAGRSSSPRASPRSSAARSTSPPAARPTSTPRRSAARSPARCSSSRCARTTSASGATAAPTRATTSSASTATACSPTRRCASTSPGSTSGSSTSWAAARRCPRTWRRRASTTR